MLFELLPKSSCMIVIDFLEWRDIVALKRVCRKAHQVATEHKIWIRECLRCFFSYDLEMISQFYEDEKYRVHIKSKAENFTSNAWSALFEQAQKDKSNFQRVLSLICPQAQAVEFTNFFYQQLREPQIPSLRLKRETIICSTNTPFQNKLSEVLYEDTTKLGMSFSLDESAKEVIDMLRLNESVLLNELKQDDKEQFAKARWYNHEHKKETAQDETFQYNYKTESLLEISNLKQIAETNETQIMNSGEALLLQLHDAIGQCFTHYCAIISEYLNELQDAYDLLAEYTTRWNAYVTAMIEFETTFETFTKLFNEAYEKLFAGYPSYPKFSIWRLMVKTWFKEVYQKPPLVMRLKEAFLRILSTHREKNVKDSVNNNFGHRLSEQLTTNTQSTEIPKMLYLTLNIKQLKSYKNEIHFGKNSIELFGNEIFGGDQEAQKKLLSSFLHSMLDISLNEVNIHYLDCTDMETNYPYQEFENAFLKQSEEFYAEHEPFFRESPNYFCQFLKSDFSLLAEILVERTSTKLETIQVRNALNFLQKYVCCILGKCDTETLKKIENTQELKNVKVDEMKNFLEELLLGCFMQSPSFSFEKFTMLPCASLEGVFVDWKNKKLTLSREIIPQLVSIIESSYSDFRKNFEFLNDRIKYFQRLEHKNAEIKYQNTSKNIPADLGEIDSLFYDLDKSVNIELLEKLYKDMIEAQKKSKKEISPLTSDESLECMIKEMGNEDIEGDFGCDEDFDLDNLPSLGDLALKK